ncbi:MAG: hypothetical protein IJ540_01760 [Prevotella sp.]|jgi:hypothetical protein|nr:hypothetical protein [Prevotella sp.]MBQ8456318.1 hypothetical protein [Prevotella sp.]
MKKILNSGFCLLAAMALFTACSTDDGENGSFLISSTPAVDVLGTYSGSWATKVNWVTDELGVEPKERTLVDTQVDGKVVSRTIEGNAYSCDLSVIGKSGVAGVDETGAATTYDILAGDETTASLKTKVNIFQTSDGTYHLINMVAASDPALGLQNTAGVKGSIVDNVMKLSFAQQVKTTKIAKIEEVVNAAAGLCNKAEKRAVYGTSTQIKTYNYSFTGTKQ